MKTKLLFLTSMLVTTGSVVFGSPIIPGPVDASHYFGPLSGATWGGSGIPNDATVSQTTIHNNNDTITLALSATQRYSNPALGNDGAGTFFATPGLNDGLVGASLGTTWNFDWYINLADNTGAAYSFALKYGNNTSDVFNTLSYGLASHVTGTQQDSWNLTMTSFLNGISFDPTANAVYGFQLEAFDSNGNMIGTDAINVNVSAVPDAASTAMLLGLGFIGLAAVGYKQNRLLLTK